MRLNSHSSKNGITYLLPISLKNVLCDFVIDTGSVVTILSRSVFNTIPEKCRPKLRKPKKAVVLEVADTGLLEMDGVASINFTADNKHFKWDMLRVCSVFRLCHSSYRCFPAPLAHFR